MKKTDRVILHCDLNNFFASVSLLFNQTLVNRPVAVAGDAKKRHGIILAKNEQAKKYGVKTAEVIWQAKQKCPDLIILPPDYKRYEEYSLAAREIYKRYTDMVEPFGIDECWLDVTGSTMLFGSGTEIAQRIRSEIKEELGITVSVGVSFNKVFAKLGSDLKKPDAVTVISRQNFKEKVWPLAIENMLFAGKKSVKRLNESGVFTIGDITLCSDEMLEKLLGVAGIQLKKYAAGLDDSPVKDVSAQEIPKSIGRSVTGEEDFTNNDEVYEVFVNLCEEISKRLRKHGLYAGGIQVHTRNSELKVKEFSLTPIQPTDMCMTLAHKAMELFRQNYYWNLPLRSVGVRAINLKGTQTAVQQSLFENTDSEERLKKIEDSIYEIRDKFGDGIIKRGRTCREKKQ